MIGETKEGLGARALSFLTGVGDLVMPLQLLSLLCIFLSFQVRDPLLQTLCLACSLLGLPDLLLLFVAAAIFRRFVGG